MSQKLDRRLFCACWIVAAVLVVKAVVLISMDDDLLELQDQHHHKILGMEADIDALTRELGETVRPLQAPHPHPRGTPPTTDQSGARLNGCRH